MSLETVTCSYFGPVADQIVIDTGQFDRFGIISSKARHQSLDSRIEVENQAARMGIPYHALQPEKRRYPCPRVTGVTICKLEAG